MSSTFSHAYFLFIHFSLWSVYSNIFSFFQTGLFAFLNYWIGQPTPVFLPEESHGQRSLMGYSPWGCKVLGKTWRPSMSSFFLYFLIKTFFWGGIFRFTTKLRGRGRDFPYTPCTYAYKWSFYSYCWQGGRKTSILMPSLWKWFL